MRAAASGGALGANIGAGLLSSIIMLCYALSYAALIFSGDLSTYLPSGVLVTLICCVVVAPVIALSSSIRFSIGGPDGNSAAILAGMAGGIAADLGGSGSADMLVTLLAALALSSLLSGVLLYLLGATRGSALIQFLPYPVMGGYLAGTGYLLLAGSFRVLTGEHLQWQHLHLLPDLPWLAWLPALVVCVALMTGARRIRRFTLVVPIGIGAGLLVFFAGLAITGMTPEQARHAGLLFEGVQLSALQLPLLLPPEQIHWRVIASHLPEFFVVAAVSALTILLNATGAGLACRQEPDLDQEMRAAGVANLLSGALGGMVGYQSLSRTLLNHRAGGVSRVSGLAAAGGCLVVVLVFPGLIGWMPKAVLVGLQLYLGIALLQEWLWRSYRRLGRAEYLLIPLIVVVIAVHGVVAGVALGVVAACLLFVIKYGRISAIRSEFDGCTASSNVERALEDVAVLRAHGDQVIGASLHGFLFFATANAILQHVRARLATSTAARYVVLDFRRIDGLDASTSASFLKLRQICEAAGVTLVLTALPHGARYLLRRAGLFNDSVQDCASLDVGMEWLEERLLASVAPAAVRSASGLRTHFSAAALARFEAQLTPRTLAAGELLFACGDPGDAVYLVEHGRVTVSLPLADGGTLRLRSFGAGTIVGEMALYTQNPRSADVRADAPTLVKRLSLAALQQLEAEDSDTAQQFHRFVVNVLASRLSVANQTVRAAQ